MSSSPGSRESTSVVSVTAAAPSIPDFELVRIVGRGSYGDVWLARSVTGAWRAIKIVWRERFTNAEPFEREFRGLKEFADVCLGESSQMTLLHVGRNDAAGFFYYVMELADDAERGRNIDPASYVPLTLAELRTRRGRIPADECARFGVDVARGLASLHRRGLVHRDVKPSNVILVSGVSKLADVGLVAPTASAHTFVGTEGYVPPEGPGAPSADVFALAKVLYELSTGHDRQEFPKLPADLARLPDHSALLELNEIFLRACGPTSAERYRDGAAILADLTALNAGVSLRTRRVVAFVLRVAAAVVMVAALGAAVWAWKTRRDPMSSLLGASHLPHTVAVLPFANATGVPAKDFLAVGISDEILHALERESDVRVRHSWSSFWAKEQTLPSTEIARRLRVALLVEGTLERADTRIRVRARLTRGSDGATEDLGTFEREPRELFALKEDVARAAAQKILHRAALPAAGPPTKNQAAYGQFLRGRALQVQGVTHAAAAAEHFKNATGFDPAFAAAWARRADALRTDGTKDTHGMWEFKEALDAANHALALQPDLALGLAVRGMIRGVGEKNPLEGLRDLDRAEALGGANAETRMTRLLLSFFAGETLGMLPRALEAIDSNPENIERVSVVVLALSYIGAYAEADRLYQSSTRAEDFVARVYLRRTWRGAKAALRLAEVAAPNPDIGIAMRVRMLAELGRAPEAAKLLEGVTEPQWELYAIAGLNDPARELAESELPGIRKKFADLPEIWRTETELAAKDSARSKLIFAEIVLDHRESALSLLDAWRAEMEKRMPLNRRAGGPYIMNLARYYAMLGQHEAAIAVLGEFMKAGRALGYDLRDIAAFDSIREDPSFLDLRRRSEEWAAMQPDPADEPPASPRKSP